MSKKKILGNTRAGRAKREAVSEAESRALWIERMGRIPTDIELQAVRDGRRSWRRRIGATRIAVAKARREKSTETSPKLRDMNFYNKKFWLFIHWLEGRHPTMNETEQGRELLAFAARELVEHDQQKSTAQATQGKTLRGDATKRKVIELRDELLKKNPKLTLPSIAKLIGQSKDSPCGADHALKLLRAANP